MDPAPSTPFSPGKTPGYETNHKLIQVSGGESGIRTHDRVLPYTPLAGARLRPLGHLSVYHRANTNLTSYLSPVRRVVAGAMRTDLRRLRRDHPAISPFCVSVSAPRITKA